MPRIAKLIAPTSAAPPGLAPAMTPSGKAIAIATSIAAPVNSSVAGNRAAINRVTGLFHRNRLAQVAVHEAPQEARVLRGDWTVESEFMAQAGNIGRPRGVAKRRDHRVAGH